MSLYRTIKGDMGDAIGKAHYGKEDQVITVYEANPGLTALGPVLPMGILIDLPDLPEVAVRAPIRLWGTS